MDLCGCWLLTEDAILSFCKKYTQTEVRHELVHVLPSNPNGSTSPSPSLLTSRTLLVNQKQGNISISPSFVDQRLKYNREELLSLQYSSLSLAIPLDGGSTTSQLLMNQSSSMSENAIEVDNSNGSNKASSFKCIPIYVIGSLELKMSIMSDQKAQSSEVRAMIGHGISKQERQSSSEFKDSGNNGSPSSSSICTRSWLRRLLEGDSGRRFSYDHSSTARGGSIQSTTEPFDRAYKTKAIPELGAMSYPM
ncbi:hypothetical protein CMV_016864 [Castanea mollissima]|uniref:Uncharacterized protein n=1 Tax=Castanea mollissima TaxID=60419 RepID=A0A8J4R768_9ROSI|nr:hypothetical protein CMV_016864 [Castanea mollissima]